MSDKHIILSVDDEPYTQGLVEYALEEEFQLNFATSGQEALDKLKELTPELILLDVRMPGMDGYETCRQIKADSDTAEVPVIFVSGMDSLEERLAGYDAGCDDYIIKPFEPKELRNKVRLNIQKKIAKDALHQSFNDAMQTAMTAMTSTGELGVVLNFLSQSFKCDDYKSLAQAVVDAMNSYDLKSCVQIRAGDAIVELDYDGSLPSSIESSLLTKLSKEKRIFDFGARSSYNFPGITLLIKNMPMEDQERYGRMKDNIALLAEGADARVQAIAATMSVMDQQEALTRLLKSMQQTVADVSTAQEKHKLEYTNIMEGLINDVEDSFLHLGLEDSQEKFLLHMIKQAAEKVFHVYQQGTELDGRLKSLLQQIEMAVKRD